jgi:hypothetical protein
MTQPSGKIVGRPMVVRACGHEQEFQHYAVDKYRAQRLAKFQQTRCSGAGRSSRLGRKPGPHIASSCLRMSHAAWPVCAGPGLTAERRAS